jgi:hypothetical protein
MRGPGAAEQHATAHQSHRRCSRSAQARRGTVQLTLSGGRPTVQRALVFLGVVLAVVIIDWQDQRRETSLLRAELSGAMSALSADPDSIVRVEWTTQLGPGGVDRATASCPAGYRVVYGRFHSVSPDSRVFFSGSFGSTRTWSVGLDNFDSRTLGEVKVVAACEPADRPVSARAEKAARKRVKEAVAAQEASHR